MDLFRLIIGLYLTVLLCVTIKPVVTALLHEVRMPKWLALMIGFIRMILEEFNEIRYLH